MWKSESMSKVCEGVMTSDFTSSSPAFSGDISYQRYFVISDDGD